MKDKEKKRLYDIEYRNRNYEKARGQRRAYYYSHRENILAVEKVRRNREDKHIHEYRIERNHKLRLDAINAYGRKCSCCGEERYNLLCIDHVRGNGNKHRKEVGGTAGVYKWLRDNNYPDGFRVLCHNCNMAISFYGSCHQDVNLSLNRGQKYILALREKVMAHYGGKCECCGETNIKFLSIDHIYCGGTKHRRSITRNFYNWIIENDYPYYLRILCFNCNLSRYFYLSCPHEDYSI